MKMRWVLAALGLAMSSAAVANKAEVKSKVQQMVPPNIQIEVKDSAMPGFYLVELGNQIVMMSQDGKYLIDGDVVDLSSRTNLIEAYLDKKRFELMKQYTEKDSIEFKAKNEKRVLKVFTDVDCPYCHKFHQQVPDLNKAGITVQYFAYPRSAKGSATYRKAEGVWCADNKQEAITVAKSGGAVNGKTCDIVAKHKALGESVGVTGTPSLVFDNGVMIPGYVPTQKLLEYLR